MTIHPVGQLSQPIPGRTTPPRKLLDRVRDACRYRQLSLRTENCYVNWARCYILFHGKRYPDELGADRLSREATRFR